MTDPEADRSYVAQQMADQLTTIPAAHGKRYDLWIVDRVLREGWRITVRSHNAAEAVYEVNAPAE